MDISFIMIEPAVPENIGAAARALKTMGFSDLRLVNPTNHLADPAKWLAHGSHDILQNATIYHDFHEATKGLGFLIGTTAKNRSAKEDYYSPEEAKEIIEKKKDILQKVGIVFGREESGLKNEELRRCDIASTINLKNPYPSINLAQSVMVYAYVFSSFALEKPVKEILTDEKANLPDRQARIFQELKTISSAILHDLNIDKNPNLYHRILERIATVKGGDARLFLSFAKKFRQKFE